MQKPFKINDTLEAKMRDVALPTLDQIGDELDAFFQGAYTAFPLGDVLHDLNRAPTVGVLPKEVFRQSFFAIFDLFTRPGTFEFYISVLRAIYGNAVFIEFDVPSPGVLNIAFSAIDIDFQNFVERRIVDNVYVYDEVTDETGDPLVFQHRKGIFSPQEIANLFAELVPAGIVFNSDPELFIGDDFLLDEDGSILTDEDGSELESG